MKYITVLVLILMHFFAGATNYYVSLSGNDNGSGTISSPWRTINKVNARFATLLPGDSVLFKRGESFAGTLIIGRSGTAASPIVIGAYGTGASPKLSNFVTVTTWTASGSLYTSAMLSVVSAPRVIEVNGALQWMGRYPNADSASGGYLYYENFTTVAPLQLIDNQLPATPNWTGANLVRRSQRWVLDVCTITGQSSTVLTYTNPVGTENTYYGIKNFGYFIQNDIRTLNQSGEWFWSTATKKLTVYAGASPTVRISAKDTGINLGSRQYITFQDLRIEGNNRFAIVGQSAVGIVIKRCNISKNNTAIQWYTVTGSTVQDCTIDSTLTNGIYTTKANNNRIQRNTIQHIGLWPGMAESGDSKQHAVYYNGNNGLIEYNTIDQIGFSAVHFYGSNITIQRNIVSNFCVVKDDGGGIYSWAPPGATPVSGCVVKNNMIYNAIGAPYGTDRPSFAQTVDARGIYLDERANGVTLLNNTIYNITGAGLFYNFPYSTKAQGNTVYNSKIGYAINIFKNGAKPVRDTLTSNIFYPVDTVGTNGLFWDGSLNSPAPTTIEAVMRETGPASNNRYRGDLQIPFDNNYHLTNGGVYVNPAPYSLTGWKTLINDTTSSYLVPALSYTKPSTGSNTVSNSTFDTNIAGVGSFSDNSNHTVAWDNTSKVVGVGSVRVSTTSVTNTYTLLHIPVGAVSSSALYSFSFKVRGSNKIGVARIYLRQTASPYTALTTPQYVYFDTTISLHEGIFKNPTSGTASIVIEIAQTSGTTWVDNAVFKLVTLSETTLVKHFDTNPSDTTLVLNFAGYRRLSVTGDTLDNSALLPPWSSLLNYEYGSAPSVAASIRLSEDTLSGFRYIAALGPSPAQSFQVTGSYLSLNGSVSLSASAGLEISITSGTAGFYNILTVPYLGNNTNFTVWVRFKNGLAPGNYNSQTVTITNGATSNSIIANGYVAYSAAVTRMRNLNRYYQL